MPVAHDSSQQIVVRQAVMEELPEIEMFLHPFMDNKILLHRTPEELARLVLHGFVARSGLDLVAFAAVEVYSRKLSEIQCLAVHPSFQGRGLAKQLIQLCVTRARELGIIEVMAITSSEQVFESCGFHYSLPDQKKALFIRPQDEPA